MTASTSGWNPTGVALLWLFAPVILLYGLVVVRNWRGLGTRLYKLTCAADIFGWYRSGGYERFRLWVGWSAVAFALLMILIGIVGLVNLV